MIQNLEMQHSPCRLERISPNDSQWDAFISSQPHHLFQKSVWAEILASGYGAKLFYYALRRGENTVLALPGILFNFKLFKIYHACTPYGGFSGDPAMIPEFLNMICAELKREGVDLVRITQNADQNYPPLQGFKPLEGYQHEINLAAANYYHKNAIRNVRKAEREGLSMRTVCGREDIVLYFEMYALAMKRLRVIPSHTRALYEAIYDLLIKDNQGTILFAQYQNKTIAGILLLYDAEKVYFLGSAFDPQFQDLRPNDFLMDRAIEHAKEKGFAIFDFMTTGASQIGLVQYKEKWGAASKPFFIHEKPLNSFKSTAWSILWRLVNTQAGTRLLAALGGGKR